MESWFTLQSLLRATNKIAFYNIDI